jgi:hypothetical protein
VAQGVVPSSNLSTAKKGREKGEGNGREERRRKRKTES